MSQSLYAAMGGISAAQTDLEVISNNIANLNTTGFKASSVNFSDVFSTTISSGSVSTASSGGTNPVQIGVGVQVSSISKNFNSGSWVSTGKNTDLMIQGNGFFTAQSSNGQVYYTRAGDFSFDNSGNLVTSSGYKVLGTDSKLSTKSSGNTVYVPQSIIADVEGTATATMGTETVGALNNCGITKGDFEITTTGGSSPQDYDISLSTADVSTNTVSQLVTDIQTQINAASTASTTIASGISTATANALTGSAMTAGDHTNLLAAANAAITTANTDLTNHVISQKTHDTIVSAANNAITTVNTLWNGGSSPGTLTAAQKTTIDSAFPTGTSGITVGINKGELTFSADGTHATGMTFSNPTTGASNFIVETGLNNAVKDSSNTYSSNVLDYSVNVTQVTSASAASSVTSYSINSDGSIQATYSNGDTLAAQLGSDNSTYEFVYTTSAGVKIAGTNCNVDPNVAVAGNFVVQLASVTNTDGLISVGSNLFESGPNTGDIHYSVGGSMGIGKIESGGLEASNVDLSTEFSNMIVAQRAVEANSRVFTTTSDVLSTVVQMGR